MKQEKIVLAGLQLIGVTVRTNNHNEMNPDTAKIGQLFNRYFNEQIAGKFVNRKNPNVTYAAYTDFESDENGDYTYFIGEEAAVSPEQTNSEFRSLMIPAGTYQKFTTDAGQLPQMVIASWQTIWNMDAQGLGGKRRYHTDFEVYDQRASDLNQAIIDIYVGIGDNV